MIWILVAGILIFIGIVGTVAPFLPGPPLVLGGLLVYGAASDFANFSGWVMGIFVGLTAFTFIIDFLGPATGARSSTGSRYGALGAIVGTLLGVMTLGPIGIVLGPVIGAFLAELYVSQNMQQAAAVARGAFLAFLIGTAIKLGVVFAMAGYFIYLLFQ